MSETPYPPVPYNVSYSKWVLDELRQTLRRAQAGGWGALAGSAVESIDSRLRTYPQFGEPKKDLATSGNVLWTLTIHPFFVEYILNEEQRMVFVITPFEVMRNAGF